MDELDTLAEKLYQSWRYGMVMHQQANASDLAFNYRELNGIQQLVWRRVAADVEAMQPKPE